MGTIADKLLYLNETKTDLRATLNGLLGLSLDANTPFRRYAYEADMAVLRAMFANGELGGYWEPALSSYYEDSAGAVPASVDGVVGAWGTFDNDRPTEIIFDNGGFDSDIANWTGGPAVVGSLTWVDGELQFTGSGPASSSANNWVYPAVTSAPTGYGLTAKRIKMEFDATWVSGGSLVAAPAGYGSSTEITAASNGGVKKRYSVVGVASLYHNALKPVCFAASVGAVWKIDNVSAIIYDGLVSIQTTTANKPYLRKTPQTSRYWLDGNTATANLTATFPSSLGSSCTIARLDPELGVQWSENQTIGTTFSLITPYAYHGPMLIINRALTTQEKAVVARVMWRFMPELGPELVTNGDMNSSEGWVFLTAVSFSGGKMIVNGDAAAYQQLLPTVFSGKSFFSVLVIDSITSGGVIMRNRGSIAQTMGQSVGRSAKAFTPPAAWTSRDIGIRATTTATESVVDRWSCQEIL